jgi:hypothetical protein
MQEQTHDVELAGGMVVSEVLRAKSSTLHIL